MSDEVPLGARPVARVLLAGPERRLLLLHAEDTVDGHRWWVTPGGGLEPGESFEQAARREVHEEVGVDVRIGPWVWTRRHAYYVNGQWHDQYERFFVATLDCVDVRPLKQDGYVVGYRWWDLPELLLSRDDFAPRRLPELWMPLARGDYPVSPIDCGV